MMDEPDYIEKTMEQENFLHKLKHLNNNISQTKVDRKSYS
jgi:hypothetical protein